MLAIALKAAQSRSPTQSRCPIDQRRVRQFVSWRRRQAAPSLCLPRPLLGATVRSSSQEVTLTANRSARRFKSYMYARCLPAQCLHAARGLLSVCSWARRQRSREHAAGAGIAAVRPARRRRHASQALGPPLSSRLLHACLIPCLLSILGSLPMPAVAIFNRLLHSV